MIILQEARQRENEMVIKALRILVVVTIGSNNSNNPFDQCLSLARSQSGHERKHMRIVRLVYCSIDVYANFIDHVD